MTYGNLAHQIGACHKCTSGGCRCNILHVRTLIDRVCRVSTQRTTPLGLLLQLNRTYHHSAGRQCRRNQLFSFGPALPIHPLAVGRREFDPRSLLPCSGKAGGRRARELTSRAPRRDAPPARPAFLLAAPNLGPSRLSAGGRTVPAGTPAARPEKARTNRRPRPPSPLFLSPPPPPLARSIQLAVVLRVNARAPPAKKNPPRRPAPATARPPARLFPLPLSSGRWRAAAARRPPPSSDP